MSNEKEYRRVQEFIASAKDHEGAAARHRSPEGIPLGIHCSWSADQHEARARELRAMAVKS